MSKLLEIQLQDFAEVLQMKTLIRETHFIYLSLQLVSEILVMQYRVHTVKASP